MEKRAIGYKLLLGRLWLDKRGKFFTMRAISNRNNLPRETDTFKIRLDGVQGHPAGLCCSQERLDQMILQVPSHPVFSDSTIWFYDTSACISSLPRTRHRRSETALLQQVYSRERAKTSSGHPGSWVDGGSRTRAAAACSLQEPVLADSRNADFRSGELQHSTKDPTQCQCWKWAAIN